jgi:hypothetical protein
VPAPLALPFTPLNLAAAARNGVPPIPWLVPGWLAEHEIAEVIGDAYIGKSTTVASLVVALTRGAPWCGIPVPRPIRVLYFDAEQPASECVRMFLRLGATDHNLTIVNEQLVDLASEAGFAEVERMVAAIKPELVVFDSVQSTFAGVAENDAQEVGTVFRRLLDLRHRHKLTVLLIHHPRKAQAGEGRERKLTPAGSRVFESAPSTWWTVEKGERIVDPDSGESLQTVEVWTRKRRGTQPTSLRISYRASAEDGPITLRGEGPVEDDMAEQERAELFIVGYLEARGESKTADIKRACEAQGRPVPGRTVERSLGQLVNTKAIRRIKKGLYASR